MSNSVPLCAHCFGRLRVIWWTSLNRIAVSPLSNKYFRDRDPNGDIRPIRLYQPLPIPVPGFAFHVCFNEVPVWPEWPLHINFVLRQTPYEGPYGRWTHGCLFSTRWTHYENGHTIGGMRPMVLWVRTSARCGVAAKTAQLEATAWRSQFEKLHSCCIVQV